MPSPAARRETAEETGIAPESLELAAVVHVMAEPVVLLFVFTGTLPAGELRPSDEGRLLWLTDDELRFAKARLVPDLVDLGASNRKPEFFAAVIARLDKDANDPLAARLIARLMRR